MPRHDIHSGRRRRAFTLIEMLTVVAIVILLISLLVVGLSKASRAAQVSKTRTLMQALKQACVQFERDTGYHPPMLGLDREHLAGPALVPGGAMNLTFFINYQNYQSETSLAEYLIGYGGRPQDGYGEDPREVPFTGIRSPGRDGVWGATRTTGALAARAPIPPEDGGPADVLGPYLELDEARLLGCVDTRFTGAARYAAGRILKVAFPGQPGYAADAPKVICDYWGNAIQYFRRPYPTGAPDAPYRANVDNNGDGFLDDFDHPSLSTIIRLRPWSFVEGRGADSTFWSAVQPNHDSSTSIDLEGASFALFSPGPDRKAWLFNRVDNANNHPEDPGGEWNRDNIVETGP